MSVGYRPEIDGLRAIAVLGVLIYHAELVLGGQRIVSAGFLGVDVFFVISGFLITRILCSEVGRQTFSFLNFYERRARRILPVLFFVIACTMPLAWWLMLPPALLDYAGSVMTSLLYSSNFWFWSSDSYWGQASSLKPLLHTWSLSLEEQFYFIAPILVVLLARKTKLFVATLVVLLVASFATAEYWSQHNAESAFYLLPARAWELLVGSLAAVYHLSGKRIHVSHAVQEVVSVVGLLMIVLPMLMFDSQLRHPSIYTLLPVIGTAIIILASQFTLTGALLAIKPMVWIGLLSYSIYLWHFPIFAFFKIALIELSTVGKFLCMVLSIVLALISYRLIEKPCRNSSQVGGKTFVSGMFVSMALMLGAAVWAYVGKGLPKRFDDFNNVLSYLDYPYKQSFLSHQCFLHPEDLKANTGFIDCPYSRLHDELRPTMYLWGDSNAAHLIPGLRQRYEASHNLVIRTISGCGVFMTEKKPTRPGCKDHNADSLQQIIEHKPDTTIIAGLWKPEFVERLKPTLALLKDAGVQNVYVVGPVPQWTPSLPAAILQHKDANPGVRNFPLYLPDKAQEKISVLDQRMEEMVLSVGYEYFSPYKRLCPRNSGCLTHVNGGLVQWDYGHLTDLGSIEIVSRLEALLNAN